MLAMPMSSSEPTQQAVLQFIVLSTPKSSLGLSSLLSGSSSSSDTGGTIFLRDTHTGALEPRFLVQFSKSKPNVILSKITPDGSSQVIGTSEKSEMSGNFRLLVHGQAAEMGYDSWGIQRLAVPSIGDFKIETGLSGSSVKFVNSQKTKIAKFSWSDEEPTLDIYVQGAGDFLVETLVLGGMALMYSGKRQAKQVNAGFEVINALTGMPGVGG